MRPIIVVDQVGKRYRIGRRESYQTFRDNIVEGLKRTFRRNGASRSERDEEIWALKDVSLEVKPGEVVGIIGRNGAGKSTLLKILSRITLPTTGGVDLFGRVASLLEVGTGFHAELTGRENIYLNGAILGMKREEIRRKFDEIVSFAEVEKYIDTPVKRYSSGMYLRLAFAVAAHLEPEILVVDEVLAVGDASFQKKCLGKMGEVAREGRTVLFVSHNLPAVVNLCTRAVVLAGGRIEYEGNTQRTIEHYLGDGQTTGGVADLRDHVGRHRGSRPTLESIALRRENGEPADSIRMGESLNIEVVFKSDREIARPRCGIGINDSLGQRVISFATFYDSSFDVPETVYGGKFKCLVHNACLSAGTFSATVTIADAYSDIDRVEEAIRFEVTPDDVFGTGWIPSSGQGRVWTRHQQWSYVAMSPLEETYEVA